MPHLSIFDEGRKQIYRFKEDKNKRYFGNKLLFPLYKRRNK